MNIPIIGEKPEPEPLVIDRVTVEHLSTAFLSIIRIYYLKDSVPRPEKPLEVLNAIASATAVIIQGCDERAEKFFFTALELCLTDLRQKDPNSEPES